MSLKEIICAIAGHSYSESGHETCMKHEKSYGHYRICDRCGLQENTSPKYCEICYAEFKYPLQEVI